MTNDQGKIEVRTQDNELPFVIFHWSFVISVVALGDSVSKIPSGATTAGPLGGHKVHKSVKFCIMAGTAMIRSDRGTVLARE